LTLSFFRKSNGVIQIFLGNVSLVDKSQLPPIQTFNRARGLRRSQIAAVTEGGPKWRVQFSQWSVSDSASNYALRKLRLTKLRDF
jgi:hypothetical protein